MFADDKGFEDEVLRIARLLWPAAAFSGSSMEAGRERDGVFITDEMVHLLECTTSRRKDKAQQDVGKLVKLAQQMRTRYPMKGVKGWFVTLEEPTADQRSVVNSQAGVVVAVSYRQFKSQIVDADAYIDHRMSYSFGSMQDPDTGGPVKNFYYVKSDLVSNAGQKWSVHEIASELLSGKRFVLIGDYGAGKSTTTREIFLDLAKRYRANRALKFPIILNLRKHHGQTDPAEALERHARHVGYPHPHHLVRAWLGGDAIVILDGFDEIAILGWSGQAKKLRDIRYRSMELIREFIRNTPKDAGIIVSGRSFFFDNNDKELRSALGLGLGFTLVSLSDFTEPQIKEFLNKKGWKAAIPTWFPSRPLLLGYIASKGLLEQLVKVDSSLSPASGWNELLTRICDRESEIEAGIDGETVRHLIEHLATKARRSSDGLGPLAPQEIVQAFEQICGYSPDDRGIVLLQRLPGLGSSKQEDGSRDFIDRDFAEAARAGDLVRFIENPFTFEISDPSIWQTTLGQLGRELAANLSQSKGFNDNKITSAIHQAARSENRDILCADLVEILKETKYSFRGSPIAIQEVMIQDTSFGDAGQDFSSVNYKSCLFQRLEIPPDADPNLLPRFSDCYVSVIEGRISIADLPKGVFDTKCVFDEFGDSAASTNAIMALSLPMGIRVLLTVLKKLYLQPGSGRKESALFRGLDHKAKSLVPEILQLLRREGLVVKSSAGDETVWLPVRSEGVRVRRLISAPTIGDDPLIKKAALIE